MVVVGLVLGAIAAYYGGLVDSFIMRTADVFFAFPYILFAIALIAVLGQGVSERLHCHRVLGVAQHRPSVPKLDTGHQEERVRRRGPSHGGLDPSIIFRGTSCRTP